MYSGIFAYNPKDNTLTDTYKRFDYLDGSQGLNWQGFQIESLETTSPVNKTIFFKDYYFSMALKDIEFQVNEHSYATKAGDVFITPRNTSFDLVNKSAFTTIRCTMSHEFLKQHFYDKNIDHLNFTENYQINDSNIRYLMLLIYEQASENTDFSDPYLNHLFDAFVTHYIKEYSDYNKAGEEGLMDAKRLSIIDRYIDENLSETISSKSIADLIGMSNYTFLNEFKHYTKETPHQYMLKKKLELAKSLLKNSHTPIMSISLDLGFNDSSHFANFFKKQTGLSPSKYRKTN